MIFCCDVQSSATNFTPEWGTAIATFILASLTFILAIIGIFQLFDIRKYIKIYANIATNNEALNTVMKQIEFHYILIDRVKEELRNRLQGNRMEPFEFMYKYLKDAYNSTAISDIEQEDLRIIAAFDILYAEYGGLIGNYYKNLYSLVKFINDYDQGLIDRQTTSRTTYYINLVKSQLSKFEILLLAYDCIWILKKPKPIGENFIEYASSHNLLSALESNELISQAHIAIFNGYTIEFDHQTR